MGENKTISRAQNIWRKIFIISSVIFALCGLGFSLALFFSTGFIEDEIYTYLFSHPSQSFLHLFKTYYIEDVTPPLYAAFMYMYNQAAFFNTEIWLRLPSLLFWLSASVAGWFYFPKHLGRRAKIIFTTLMLASSTMGIYLASARAYGLLLLLSVLFTFSGLNLFYTLLADGRASCKKINLFFIFGLLLCFTHYYGAVFFVILSALLLAYAFVKKMPISSFIWRFILTLGVFMLWVIPNFMVIKSHGVFDGSWWNNSFPVWFSFSFFFNIIIGSSLAQLTALAAVCAGLLILKDDKGERNTAELILPPAAYLLVYLALYVISFKINIMQPRYFIVLAPLVFFFMAKTIGALLDKKPLFTVIWVLFLIFSFKSNIDLTEKYYNHPRNAKAFAQQYIKEYKGRTILLASFYPYNPKLIDDVYSYYIKNFYNYPQVTTINLLDKDNDAAAALALENTVIYMPGCGTQEEARLKTMFHIERVYKNEEFYYCLFKEIR